MAGKIKVLIVDDNEDTRYIIKQLLDMDEDIEIIGFAEDGKQAIEKVIQTDPHVTLMDINMKGLNGIEATQRLKSQAPTTKVIIVSVQDDPNYMRSAMRAGAVDFLAKPPQSDDLIQAVHRAYEESIEERESASAVVDPGPGPRDPGPGPRDLGPEGDKDGSVIAVMGLKGGVGKSTLAVSLAVGLARASRGTEVLLIDTNSLSGDVHVFLNTRGQYSTIDLAYMAQESELEAGTLDNVLVPHDSGIKLLVAPRNPLEADPISSAAFTALIDQMKKRFDYVVLDTAPTIDESVINASRSANYIVAVLQANMPALKDSQIMLNMFRELGVGDLNTTSEDDPDAVIVTLNAYNEDETNINPEQIGNFLRHKVDVKIDYDPNAVRAVNKGIPLITADSRRAKAVEGLNQLVKIIRARVEGLELETAQVEEKKKSGWFPFGN